MSHSGNEDNNETDNQKILELVFISAVGLIMLAAFLQALTYQFISARTPIVILVPLLILIGMQIKHAWTACRGIDIASALSKLGKGGNAKFNSAAGFIGWMILLLLLIFVTGHYVGIAAFMFILIKLVANEKTSLSVSVSAGVTLFIYILFEQVLSMELYRGMIYRVWAGYSVF